MKRKGILAFIWIAAVAVSLQSPALAAAEHLQQDWIYEDEAQFGSTIYGIQPAADGGWAVSGYKDEMFTVQKVSAQGEEEWEYVFYPGLVAFTLISTSDGGFLAAGQTHFLDDELGVQAIAVKLDKDGNFEWQREFGVAGHDVISSVAETSEGYLIAGNYEGRTDKEAVLTRIGFDGEVLGKVTLSPKPKYDIYGSMTVRESIRLSDGGYLAAAEYDSIDERGSYEMRSVLIKLNERLEEEWQTDIRNVYAMSPMTDGGSIIATQTQSRYLGLIRVDKDGEVLWENEYAPLFSKDFYEVAATGVIPSIDGGYLVTGAAHALNQKIAYLVKVDQSGKREWEKPLFKTNSSLEGIARNAQNQYAATGITHEGIGIVMQFRTAEKLPVRVEIDGVPLAMNQKAEVVSNTTLLPMRPLFEALDAHVTYMHEEKKVIGERGDRKVELTLGKKEAIVTVNGVSEIIELAVPAQSINNSTMVPIRFVGEALGDTIIWHDKEQLVEVRR